MEQLKKDASPTEYDLAVAIAQRILDRPYADPDDDQAILARTFLRLCGLI